MLGQLLRQRVIDFLEDFARGGEGIGQRLAHADRLAALSGKQECASHWAADKSRGPQGVKFRGSARSPTLALYALGWTAAALLAAVLALGLTDYAIRFQDRGIRLMASLAVMLVLAWACYRFWYRGFGRRLGDVELAQRVERRFPNLANRLTSAIQFLKQPESDVHAGSAALRRAVILETASASEKVNFSEACEPRPTRQALAAAAGLALVALVLLLAVAGLRGRDCCGWHGLGATMPGRSSTVSSFEILRGGSPWGSPSKSNCCKTLSIACPTMPASNTAMKTARPRWSRKQSPCAGSTAPWLPVATTSPDRSGIAPEGVTITACLGFTWMSSSRRDSTPAR